MTTNIIRRYAVSGDIAYPIHEDPEGDCVTYEDHVAAIEPYAKRIAELEAQLEAIGAGGVTQGQRLIEADRKRIAKLRASGSCAVCGSRETELHTRCLECNAETVNYEQSRHNKMTHADRKRRGEPVKEIGLRAEDLHISTYSPTPEEEAWQQMERRS